MTRSEHIEEFTPNALGKILRGFGDTEAYLVGFSGGLDSTVLLHALADLRPCLDAQLRVLHVNHSLNPAASEWATFCEKTCRALDIRFEQVHIDARAPVGESPEDWARRLRYDAFATRLGERETLLTAHHLGDQAETLLLQLLRGAGPRGLAAMPRIRPFHRGHLARPLLDFTRQALHRFATQRGICWIDDSSNCDPRFDRNYIRHEILPRLQQRWPRCQHTLARAADWQAEASALLEATATQDLASVLVGSGAMSISKLLALSTARRNAALRNYLRMLGLPIPNAVHLQRIEQDVLQARWDSLALVRWADVEVRRYRDVLYVQRHARQPSARSPVTWDLLAQHELRLATGHLIAREVPAGGVSTGFCTNGLVKVRYRQGGESCKPYGSAHTRRLKDLFQAHGVPPWLRDDWPLIYIGDSLAAVPNLCICVPFVREGNPGWDFSWQPKLEVAAEGPEPADNDVIE